MKMVMTDQELYFETKNLESILFGIKTGRHTVKDLKIEARRLVNLYAITVRKVAKNNKISITNHQVSGQ